MKRFFGMAIALGLWACDDGGGGADSDSDALADSDETDTTGDDTDPDTEDDTNDDGEPWTLGSHACDSRTTALWFDDAATGFLGCGEATTGHGFWTTTDGGVTWSDVSTTPAGWFGNFRVAHIFRDGGLLYASGTGGGLGVVGIDATGTLTEVWTPGGTVGTSFTVGTFLVDSTGFAVVESLTGTDVMTRPDASVLSTDWTEVGTSWSTDGESHQILDMDLYEDQVYAVGSVINQPPYVFLPNGTAPPAFELDPVALSSGAFGYIGEMWAIDVDAGGIVVGGVDQELDVGHVYTIDHATDASVASNWHDYSLATLWPSDPTWVRGVCRSDDTVVAVGELSVKSDGVVLLSTDGGSTYTDITPSHLGSVPTLWDCWVHDDGSLVVTGASFYAAVYVPGG